MPFGMWFQLFGMRSGTFRSRFAYQTVLNGCAVGTCGISGVRAELARTMGVGEPESVSVDTLFLGIKVFGTRVQVTRVVMAVYSRERVSK